MSELDDLTVERIARAFWHRIEPHKNKWGKDLPKELPVEFRANMATALMWLPDNNVKHYASFKKWFESVGEEYDNQHDAAFGGFCEAMRVMDEHIAALDTDGYLQEQDSE